MNAKYYQTESRQQKNIQGDWSDALFAAVEQKLLPPQFNRNCSTHVTLLTITAIEENHV